MKINKDTERLNWIQKKRPTIATGLFGSWVRVEQNLHHNQQEIVGAGRTLRQAIDIAMKRDKGTNK